MDKYTVIRVGDASAEGEQKMLKFRGMFRFVYMTIMVTVLISCLFLFNCRTVFAVENTESKVENTESTTENTGSTTEDTESKSENTESKTEYVTADVYQYEGKGSYDISSADKSSSAVSGAEPGGKFSIAGRISTVTKKNGMPAYSVSGGTLKFSYVYDDHLLTAPEDEEHLIYDKSKNVNGVKLDSGVEMGALIVQTSKDGQIWFNVPGETYTNIFKDEPEGLKEFYTTTDVQMVNGCYYRVLVAYKTGIRTQKVQKFPPKFEKHEYMKTLEAYCFYAYDETAMDITVPENNNRRNLGSKVRTKSEGYAGSAIMNNDDPHFGWDIGQFFVGGFTDYEDDTDGNPIFLKNNGDRLSLWFELQQNIDKCYENSAIKVIPDTEGSDSEFGVPGGVNETTDFGRGALIIRKTNPDNTKEKPQIYTNYLEASASTDAVTKVDLLEEGDYEAALDYTVKFDKTRIFGKSILPETAKYRISFKFSVRNGNSMIFLFDKENGSELSSGAFTENGFRLDFANSRYLRVTVKREILKDGFDGLTQDTRFNSVASDGDEFTEEGVYTLTITNRDLENVDPTIKRIYVGTDNILKAYMVNNIPISEIKEKVAAGATIEDDGTIRQAAPETESGEEKKAGEEEVNKEPAAIAESETNEETPETVTEEQAEKNAGLPMIPVIAAVLAAAAGVFFFRSRRKK